MSSISFQGLLSGKQVGQVTAAKTRAILPLPSLLIWLDRILCNYWQPVIDGLFPDIKSAFIEASPFTQTLDIMHGLQGVIDKGLDSHGHAAIAQMDIKKYYDSISIIKAFQYLVSRGGRHASAACLLRLHYCLTVELHFDSAHVTIDG